MYKVCFVLPGIGRKPVGGYKMVYEYANRLVNDGCDVSILYINDRLYKEHQFPEFARKILVNKMTEIEPKWFNLDKRIKKVSTMENRYWEKLGRIDVGIATAVETVDFVYASLKADRKAYFIQDYETWNIADSVLGKTYKLGMINVVISNWLKEIVDNISGKSSILIQNPIDNSIYTPKIEINKRKQHTIALLYHTGKHKGLPNAMEAIYKLKELYPDLSVKMFGVPTKPSELPNWITYYKSASQAETVKIYNWCQVFLSATIKEGYGLTGIEAMSCGACLVSTDYTGVREYAVDGYNALLSPVGDIDAQVKNVIRVFEDADLREKLSQNGIKTGSKYSWEEATQKFEQAIGYKK